MEEELERSFEGVMEEQAIRDLVKEYALAINDTLLDKALTTNVAHHEKVWALYSKFYDLSQQERLVVYDECRRLVSSKELPEPVLSLWGEVSYGRGKCHWE